MKVSQILTVHLGLLLLTGTANSQQLNGHNEMCSDPSVQKILKDVQIASRVPAVGGALITPYTIKSAVFGRRRSDGEENVTLSDFFQLGSCTKSMTSLMAAMLVENNKIRWTTTVSQAFPEFAAQINPQLRNITLTQLLTHRSGIRSLAGEVAGELVLAGNFTGSSTSQRLEFSRLILSQPPTYKIGSFHYSNAGYGIAGAMLERASGKTFEEMLQQNLFSRIGGHVRLWFPTQNDPAQPWGHFENGANFIPLDPEVRYDFNQVTSLFNDISSGALQPTQEILSGLYEILNRNRTITPAGGASTNVLDLARYTQLHLLGELGFRTIVSPRTMRQLHTPVGGLAMGKTGYAYGWVPLKIDGVETWFHDGSVDPFYAIMIFQPSRRRGAVSVANSGSDMGEATTLEIVGRLLGIRDLKKKIDEQTSRSSAFPSRRPFTHHEIMVKESD